VVVDQEKEFAAQFAAATTTTLRGPGGVVVPLPEVIDRTLVVPLTYETKSIITTGFCWKQDSRWSRD